MALESLPWAPFFVMATVGGVAAFFLDVLMYYLSYSITKRHWFFFLVGTLVMAIVDEVTKYIAYIGSVRREMKERLSRECICWLMVRAAVGYSVVLVIILVIYLALYGEGSQLSIYIPFILLDIANIVSCSAITGTWLYVRKHHKHATHHTVPTQLEDMCMDSVIGPAILLRYLYYTAAFSFVFLDDGSTTETALYIAINVVYAVFVGALVAMSFRFLKPAATQKSAPSETVEAYDRAGVDAAVVVFPDGSKA
ncbi:hypothetical protein DYB32_009088 [Aphanomyces invadans]|uniref:Uncharacterized protein n=1 Tax=Aphanomyces invadans TaxID=157072 RepID=A0A418AJA3_9STRA|nr:hypothetical protein DYB32_009088 [Aphanomyces invadans]